MDDHDSKHKRILNRIFHSPSQKVDSARATRMTDKYKIERLFRGQKLGKMGQQNVSDQGKMSEQIFEQLNDIQQISKFHDKHFQLQNIILPIQTPTFQMGNSCRTHMSFKLKDIGSRRSLEVEEPLKTHKGISLASSCHIPSSKALKTNQYNMQSSRNLSQQSKVHLEDPIDQSQRIESRLLRKPILSKSQLLEVIKSNKSKSTISETFSFRKFQEQFQLFWEERIEKLTTEERNMLHRLQNKQNDSDDQAENQKQDMNRKLNNLQDRMRIEFLQLSGKIATPKTTEQKRLEKLIAANRKKGESKPILSLRREKYIRNKEFSKSTKFGEELKSDQPYSLLQGRNQSSLSPPKVELMCEVIEEPLQIQREPSIEMQLDDDIQESPTAGYHPVGKRTKSILTRPSPSHENMLARRLSLSPKISSYSRYSSLINKAKDILSDEALPSPNNRELKQKIEKVFKMYFSINNKQPFK